MRDLQESVNQFRSAYTWLENSTVVPCTGLLHYRWLNQLSVPGTYKLSGSKFKYRNGITGT